MKLCRRLDRTQFRPDTGIILSGSKRPFSSPKWGDRLDQIADLKEGLLSFSKFHHCLNLGKIKGENATFCLIVWIIDVRRGWNDNMIMIYPLLRSFQFHLVPLQTPLIMLFFSLKFAVWVGFILDLYRHISPGRMRRLY